MNNSIIGRVVETITGIARPVEELPAVNPSQEIALTSGWLLLGIGIVLVIFIIFFKRRIGKEKNEQYEMDKNIQSINPDLVESFQSKYIQIKKALMKKGLSEDKANKCITYIVSPA